MDANVFERAVAAVSLLGSCVLSLRAVVTLAVGNPKRSASTAPSGKR